MCYSFCNSSFLFVRISRPFLAGSSLSLFVVKTLPNALLRKATRVLPFMSLYPISPFPPFLLPGTGIHMYYTKGHPCGNLPLRTR